MHERGHADMSFVWRLASQVRPLIVLLLEPAEQKHCVIIDALLLQHCLEVTDSPVHRSQAIQVAS